ncbi:phenylalanine--tRNA ligase subunit beta [Flavobacteriaceae bacterium]|nr:phenylalanine--tRNA ligase subunit beta [Flavobacteriaceae bacterium]
MTISYNWIKQFLRLDWSADQTAELLTDLGLEVEGIEQYSSVPGDLEGIVVGKVLSCTQHPNADRLRCTTVDIGQEQPSAIVCGAPNVAEGQYVAVATVGTTLYAPDGSPWTIKKSKIRGEASEGMICAEDELGLGDNHDGIMVLEGSPKPGTPLSELVPVTKDQLFEIGLTPNRADAMSHWGVARDLKAGLVQKGIALELITPSTSSFHVDKRSLKIEVTLEDQERAPRYAGVTLSEIKVGPSPDWLKHRLSAIGVKPINNVVDVTNYILHELGQPLHAFDAAKITGNKVIVQTVAQDTEFTTLDGVTRKLHAEDLMICNADKPMCIAGVFGGLESGVTEETTSIFLESAYFDPVSVRKTAKRHGLNTDASFRFERGIDPNTVEYALMRAAIMINELAGGHISSDITDIYPKKIADHQVFLNFETADKVIGQELPKETIKSILTSLDIKINNVTETGLGMTIPAYRNDVTREADVIEEILRVYGYNNINFSSKLNASVATLGHREDFQLQNRLAQQLTGNGYFEILNNSLTAKQNSGLIADLNPEQDVALLNPLSQDLGVMRQSMVFGVLQSIGFNLNRKVSGLRVFEFGKTYRHNEGAYEEFDCLALGLAGKSNEGHWDSKAENISFFELKSSVHQLLESIGIRVTSEESCTQALWQEGLTAYNGSKPLVHYGVIQQNLCTAFDVELPVLYAEFNWAEIKSMIPQQSTKVAPIAKFPKVKRDLALLLDQHISFDQLKSAALNAEKQLLREVSLFDVYTGKNIPEGKKSYALSFTLQDEHKTLTDKQIDKIMRKLQETFSRDFEAVLR